MADEEEGIGMNIPNLPDNLIAKYHRRLTREDMQKYQEFGELMNQVDPDLPEEERSKLVRQLTNKITGAMEVLQRMVFRVVKDQDAPDEIIIVLLEQLTQLATARGGAVFADFSIVSEMEEMMNESDDK